MNHPSAPPVTFDPFAPGLSQSPFEEYARLHRQAPIHWNAVMQAWVLTRYEDVKLALTSPAFCALRTADIVAEVARRAGRDYRSLTRFLDAALFFKAGADHLRDRRTLAAVMNRISLTDLEPTVREMARTLGLARLPRGALAQQGLHHLWQSACREKRCDRCPCNCSNLLHC